MIVHVSKDASSKFKTIQEALNSIPLQNNRRVIVSIAAGVYREKIRVTLPFITFLGDPTNQPIVIGNDTAHNIGGDGKKLGTLNSATVAVDSNYFIAVNMRFQNTASPRIGSNEDQAVALRTSGNKSAFYNCSFYGFQDTLYDHQGLHYFKNCYIEGFVDFIFGHGRSLYEGCTIKSIAEKMGYITAQDRSKESMESGFSIQNSRVIGSGKVYLGRPWGVYSRVIYSYTSMESLVIPQGWDDTMDNQNHSLTVYYGEYKCTGLGSNLAGRPPWVHRLTDTEAQQFIGTQFIQGDTWLVSPS